MAALRMHDVVVQLAFQLFPKLQRVRVEFRVARQEVVGPHNRGVAANIARAKVALFQHSYVGQPVVLGQIIGRGQPMPAAADHDGVIFGLGCGIAPRAAPACVAQKPLGYDFPTRIAHRALPLPRANCCGFFILIQEVRVNNWLGRDNACRAWAKFAAKRRSLCALAQHSTLISTLAPLAHSAATP